MARTKLEGEGEGESIFPPICFGPHSSPIFSGLFAAHILHPICCHILFALSFVRAPLNSQPGPKVWGNLGGKIPRWPIGPCAHGSRPGPGTRVPGTGCGPSPGPGPCSLGLGPGSWVPWSIVQSTKYHVLHTPTRPYSALWAVGPFLSFGPYLESLFSLCGLSVGLSQDSPKYRFWTESDSGSRFVQI